MPQDRDNKAPGLFSRSISAWGLLTSAGIVACIATVLGFMDRLNWSFDLFTHFRVQYFLGLLVLGMIFVFGKQRRIGAAFLLFALVNLLTFAGLYFPAGSKPGNGSTVRLMLLNVNTERGDPERVRNAIEKYDPQILILEELNDDWVDKLDWLVERSRGYCIVARDDNFGIGLFSMLPLSSSNVIYIADQEIPSIEAKIQTGFGVLQVLATHPLPPNGSEYTELRNEHIEAIPHLLDPSLPRVVAGDLNVTPWSRQFRSLLKSADLADSSQGRGVQPTWPAQNPALLIPIDHLLHSKEISVVRKSIGPNVGSDHYPVVVDLAVAR